MGLLDKLPGKKDDEEETPKAQLEVPEGKTELIADPAYSEDYLPKAGVGGSPEAEAEADDSGGSSGEVR